MTNDQDKIVFMTKVLALLSLGLGVALVTSGQVVLADAPLRPISQETCNVSDCELKEWGFDDQIWGSAGKPGDRQALLTSIDHSLRYLRTPAAAASYRKLPVGGITRDRVRRSLVRFRQLVVSSSSPAELQAAVNREFVLYKSVGKDDRGTVSFTGYFEPIYAASRTRTAEYRYPLYRVPKDFSRWGNTHPIRAELEGEDGFGTKTRLQGQELVWMRDRLEAFLVHVQGSARLKMPDGSVMSVGYAGKTSHPYSSIGRELVNDGKLPLEGLTLPVLIDYFLAHPEEVNRYLPRNKSFVFFRETNGAPATGSLSVPVTAERSIATDKSLMPPGALALISTSLPYQTADGLLESRLVNRYVLDQDTGSAIRGAGRVDVFMGTGAVAGDRAGVINNTGELYYLLLKQ